MKVDERERKNVMRHLFPLPRHVAVESIAVVAAGELSVQTHGTATNEQVAYGLRKLMEKLKQAAGAGSIIACDTDDRHRFAIELFINDADPALRGRSAQGYLIRPGIEGIALIGGSATGLLYGLGALVGIIASGGEKGTVSIPLLEALDYPQIDERGIWTGPVDMGLDEYEALFDWLWERKINYLDEIIIWEGLSYPSRLYPDIVHDNAFSKKNYLKEIIRMARCRGIRIAAGISHFEQKQNIVKHYPFLAGETGNSKLPEGIIPLCFSSPRTREFFANIISEFAELCEVEDVMVWLSEMAVSCRCAECSRKNEFTVQAEGIIAAWKMAQRNHPQVNLRILLSQGSRVAGNEEVMAVIPCEVKVSYYSGNDHEHRPDEPATYTMLPIPIISPYIQRYVAQGYRMGLCARHFSSLLGGMGSAELTRIRCVEAAEKGFSWLNGQGNLKYSSQDIIRAVDLNAIAEYGWNPWGRPLKEAMVSWCTREGLPEPEPLAESLCLLDDAVFTLSNCASDGVLREVLELAAQRPFLTQITNVVLQKGLGEEPEFRRIEELCRQAIQRAERYGWDEVAAWGELVRATSVIMRLSYPLWRWREKEGWLISVQNTVESESKQRLERARQEIRIILTELEEANAVLQAARQRLNRPHGFSTAAGLWQNILPEYDIKSVIPVEWKERKLSRHEGLR